MPGNEAQDPGGKPEMHALVEAKFVKVFGPDRGAALLRRLLEQLGLRAVADDRDLLRVAELLQARPGFEGTLGAMLAVMATMHRTRVR